MKRGDGGSSVVQLTTGIEDEGGGVVDELPYI